MRVVKIATDVSSHILENELILFSASQQRLFRLNSTAAFIWCSLEEHLSIDEIIQSLVDNFNITLNDATNDLTVALNEWQSSGLLIFDSNKIATVAPNKTVELPKIEYPFPLPILGSDSKIRFYKLIDTCFEVRFFNQMIERKVHTLLKHLEVIHPNNIDTHLDVLQKDDHFLLIKDGEIVDYCIEESGIVPMIHANTLMLAYNQADCLLAMHAGAISRNDQCILLPAVSGSGKSTLTAALVNNGYLYCTDDLALLVHNTHKIRPVPVSMGIKEGAWPILSPMFPELNNLEPHRRADEKLVRYLSPPASSINSDFSKTYSIRAVVFPKYQVDKKYYVNHISPAEALFRLTEAGYDINTHLTHENVDELINWIGNLECYSLEYNDLTEAISFFHKLLP